MDLLRGKCRFYPRSIRFSLWLYRDNYTDRPNENHTSNILKQLDKAALLSFSPIFFRQLTATRVGFLIVIHDHAAIVFL